MKSAKTHARPDDDKLQSIDFTRYIPTVISRFSTHMRASANKFFGERYGLSLLDWRILSHIAAVGACSAYDIWTSAALEKSAVSRAIRGLQKNGLIEVALVPGAARRTTKISLSEEGRRRYAATFEEVEKRHARLVAGLTSAQVEQLIATINHLDARIEMMGSEAEPGDPDVISIRRS
jgi:DNA-binding MarR family transcriptional regulator